MVSSSQPALQIAPGLGGTDTCPHLPYTTLGGSCAIHFCSLSSSVATSTVNPRKYFLRANSLHPFSKHLLSTAWVLETHLSQPLLLPPKEMESGLIMHLFLGRQLTKEMGKEGGGSREIRTASTTPNFSLWPSTLSTTRQQINSQLPAVAHYLIPVGDEAAQDSHCSQN